jgi:hypothetical protein
MSLRTHTQSSPKPCNRFVYMMMLVFVLGSNAFAQQNTATPTPAALPAAPQVVAPKASPSIASGKAFIVEQEKF